MGFVFVNHDHLTFLKSTFPLAPRLATMTHSKEGFVILNLQTVTVEVFLSLKLSEALSLLEL
jgi:hypothetical protein